MARYDDLEYTDHEWLLGRDEAEDIVERAGGDAMSALEEVLAFCRDRQNIMRHCEGEKIEWSVRKSYTDPNPGWSTEALGSRKMEAEYIADCVQSIIGRMKP